MLSINDWRRRFLVQAGWTRTLRQSLIRQLGLGTAGRILEVGCGTGAILSETGLDTHAALYGLDLRLDFLQSARGPLPDASFTCGNALALPYPSAAFNAVFCHFLLLWVSEPEQALAEMRRVTQPGGWVVAFAEPDYGGRIDYPPELETVGKLQTRALQSQGADPLMGRRLRALFSRAGLDQVSAGVLSGAWSSPPPQSVRDSEWNVLENDLAGLAAPDELNRLRVRDEQAWQAGERILFVPTFYACGQIPSRSRR